MTVHREHVVRIIRLLYDGLDLETATVLAEASPDERQEAYDLVNDMDIATTSAMLRESDDSPW